MFNDETKLFKKRSLSTKERVETEIVDKKI